MVKEIKMKSKVITSIVLMLIGSNIFTYSTMTYSLKERLREQGRSHIETIHDEDVKQEKTIALARAYGSNKNWNFSLGFWGLGGMTFIIGLAIPFVKDQKKRTINEDEKTITRKYLE